MMVLPVLLLIFLAIMWTGLLGIRTAEVTVAARHQAWSKRSQSRSDPFNFKNLDSGKISETKDAKISLSPLVDDLVTPKSTHSLLAGSWDSVDLSGSPNWDLYAELAQKGLQQRGDEFVRINNGLIDLPNLLASEPSAAIDNFVQRIANKVAGEGESVPGGIGSVSDIIGAFNDEESTASANSAFRGAGSVEKSRNEIQAMIVQLDAMIPAIEAAGNRDLANTFEELRDALQEQLDSLQDEN